LVSRFGGQLLPAVLLPNRPSRLCLPGRSFPLTVGVGHDEFSHATRVDDTDGCCLTYPATRHGHVQIACETILED